MEMRGYQEIRRSEREDVVEFLVKAPRREETILVWCASEKVGLKFLRSMIRVFSSPNVKIRRHFGIT